MIKKSWVLMVLFLLTPLGADVWHVHYKQAKEAARKGQWQEVISCIQEALEDSPEPKYQKKTYGLNYENYFPYYYEGLAFYRLEAFDKAENALGKCFDYAEINNDASFASEARRMLDDSRQRLLTGKTVKNEPKASTQTQTPVKLLPSSLEPTVRSDKEKEAEKSQVQAEPALSPQTSPQLDDRQKVVSDLLNEAEFLLGRGLAEQAGGKYQAILQLVPSHQEGQKGLSRVRLILWHAKYRDLLSLFFSGNHEEINQRSKGLLAEAALLGDFTKEYTGELLKLLVLEQLKQAILQGWNAEREAVAVDEYLGQLMGLGIEVALKKSTFVSPRLTERYQSHLSRWQRSKQNGS